MQAHQFLLKITGEVANNGSHDQSVAGLAHLFGLSHEAAGAVLAAARPQVIREGLDAVLAERYQMALGHIGINRVIERREATAERVVIIQSEAS